MKDTTPEINEMIFAAMMRKTPEERLLMGFDMMATAREMVWSSLEDGGTKDERRKAFFHRFHGEALTGCQAMKAADHTPAACLALS